jgi:dTDP-4-dehydrorhamnose 3,5-epimerase
MYLKWVEAELSAENMLMLFVPRGFAHGFVTLCDNVEVEYKVDNFYSKESDRSIRFDDPSIAVDWEWGGDFHLSEKDSKAPLLRETDCDFRYEGPL